MYTLLVLFFLVAIITSFLCSLWEAVLLSITPAYAKVKAKEGTATGRRLSAFKANVDRPLAAILTLNTVANTVGAIGVGNQSALIWADVNPIVATFIIPAVMVMAILIFSEIIPKTIGANYWEELAPFTVTSLGFIVAVLAPFVWISQFITRFLRKDKSGSVFSRSDFVTMAEIGAEEGVFEKKESEYIGHMLRFSTVRAEDVMTPRTVVKVASEKLTIATFFERNKDLVFSRIPLYTDDNKDSITGYILKDEMLAHLIEGKGTESISSIRRDIMVIDEDYPITKLFSRFLEKREHITLVVDEFGGMAGIVTMEDVIETLLGMEIIDELDNDEDMQAVARKNWERRAKRLGLIQESSDHKGV